MLWGDWFRWFKIKGNNTMMLIFSMDKVWTNAIKTEIFLYGQGDSLFKLTL